MNTSTLDVVRVANGLADRGVDWPRAVALASVGSTNVEAAQRAADGCPEGTCVVADEQVAGQGRSGRQWVSAPGHGLWFTLVLRPPAEERAGVGLLNLAAGVAVVHALGVHGVKAGLKWPNDVVVDGPAWDGSAGPRKLAGILGQVEPDGSVLIGIGINLLQDKDELPVPQATSVRLEGGEISREELLVEVLAGLHDLAVDVLRDGAALTLAQYRAMCVTLGRTVRVLQPSHELVGPAMEIDDSGHLVLDVEGTRTIVAAGDVVHATI